MEPEKRTNKILVAVLAVAAALGLGGALAVTNYCANIANSESEYSEEEDCLRWVSQTLNSMITQDLTQKKDQFCATFNWEPPDVQNDPLPVWVVDVPTLAQYLCENRQEGAPWPPEG